MKSAPNSTMGGKATAHSVVESSPGLRRLAGPTVTIHALTAMIPR